ncbi:MAG TPA: hypothetical protein DDY43_07585 [Synechococcales bacterium UBA10510]|nr:hypothetical protein [Synechococcales bacterium UBA10510]
MAAQRPDSDSERQRIKDLVLDANAAESRGDGQTALTLLRQAQVLAPQHQCLVASMVHIFLARSEVQEATDLAESLVAADPASVPGLIALASCQRYRRQLPEAIATYKRAAALDPHHLGVQAAIATLGRSFISASAYAEAAVGALIDKAEKDFKEQNPAKALVNFRQALALSPGNPDLLAASARCQRKLGQLDQAEALLQQSIQEHPNHFSLLVGMAELEADRGHWWVSSDWFARARAADPAAPGLEEATYQSRGAAAALPRRQMFVLGMHRSGTSATAAMLCGGGFQASLPAQTLAATASNPRGHWEPTPVVSAHDTLLEEQGLGWSDSFMPTADWEAALLPRHGEAIGEALRLAFDNESFAERILVVKDPRQCRLQPIWNRLLEQHGLEAAVVLQQRHPLAVARSLLQRDRMPANRSLLLWLQHSLAAERHTRHLPRLIVDYQQVLAEPEVVLTRCQALWPQQLFDGTVASADSAFIPAVDPTLNHAGPDPAAAMADLGPVDPVLLELALGVHGTLLGPEECRSDQLDQAWARLEQHLQVVEEQSVSLATMQLFWCIDNGWCPKNEPEFHEDHSLRATVVPLRRGYDVCTFTLPAIAGRVVALRLDPAETPTLVRIERMEILGPAGEQIWLWQIEANSEAFPGRALDERTRLTSSRSGPLWICRDSDPSILLILPLPVWEVLGEDVQLRIHSHRDLLSHELRDLLTQREQA